MHNAPRPLPVGHVLYHYVITREIGRGAFGITYLAYDDNQDKHIAIKEYLPEQYGIRQSGTTVQPTAPRARDVFDWGMNRFLEEAQTLAQFDEHPNLIGVEGYFNENGTAYIVMDYVPGELLSTYIKREAPLSEGKLRNIMQPIIDGLSEVHSKGYLHRDIKPENIILRHDGSPVLLDFGSARFAMGVKTRNLTRVLTEGYAPVEQYSETARQGPYTDIYALGAVAYNALTGEEPQSATGRMLEDRMPVLIEQGFDGFSQNFLAGIDAALQVYPKARPISLNSWLRKLGWELGRENSDKPEPDEAHEKSWEQPEVRTGPEDRVREAAANEKVIVGAGDVSNPENGEQRQGAGKTILALVLVIVIVVLLWLLLR